MEKFRYLPTVMRTGAQREDCFGLVMASFPSISEYMYVIFIPYLTEDLQCSLSPRKKIRVSEKMWFWSLKGWNFQTATQPPYHHKVSHGVYQMSVCNFPPKLYSVQNCHLVHTETHLMMIWKSSDIFRLSCWLPVRDLVRLVKSGQEMFENSIKSKNQ
jgi:hypothetical protein